MEVKEQLDKNNILDGTGGVLPQKEELRRNIKDNILKNFVDDKGYDVVHNHKRGNIYDFIDAICDADYSEDDSEWKMSFKYLDYDRRADRELDIKICKLENDKYSVTIKDLYIPNYKKSKIYKEEISADNSDDFCKILGGLLYKSMYYSIDLDLIRNAITYGHVYEVVNQKKVQQKGLEGEELRENLGSLQKKIEETKEKINWQGIRGNIEYDKETSSIKSRNGETIVEDFDGNIMKLVGLDLDLSLEEGLWLANFKNWIAYMLSEKRENAESERHRYGYGKNSQRHYIKPSFFVKYKSSIMNKKFSYKKTLYINDTMLISRENLEEYIPACSDEKVMEKIADWLKRL